MAIPLENYFAYIVSCKKISEIPIPKMRTEIFEFGA